MLLMGALVDYFHAAGEDNKGFCRGLTILTLSAVHLANAADKGPNDRNSQKS